MPADELGRAAVQALLARTGLDPILVDHVIFGCVAQPLNVGNIARVIALRAGIPATTPALTVHRNCASGFEAVTYAELLLHARRGEIFVVGGAESMSNIPLLFSRTAADKFSRLATSRTQRDKAKALAAFRPSDFRPIHGLRAALSDPFCDMTMIQTADLVAREAGISREAQDQFAFASHQKAAAAREKFAEEVFPYHLPPDFAVTVDRDNGPRDGQTIEALSRLKPIDDPRTSTVTAGNASQITDGAVALLVMSERRAASEGFDPLGVLTHHAVAAGDPARMGLGPLWAIARIERRIADADLVEINEAFAGQVLACVARSRDPRFAPGEIPMELLNVNGGAIALGHPVGASAARLALTALKELKRRDKRRALVTACVGGGQGSAMWVERP